MDRWVLLYIAGTFASIFVPIIMVLIVSGKQWKAMQEKAHARRIAEYKLNARLLRFNI